MGRRESGVVNLFCHATLIYACFLFVVIKLMYFPENSLLQRDNIRNQRENVILIVANSQSRLGFPDERDPVSICFNFLFFFYKHLWCILCLSNQHLKIFFNFRVLAILINFCLRMSVGGAVREQSINFLTKRNYILVSLTIPPCTESAVDSGM